MERILSSEEMRAMDRRAIEELGIPGICLMENAGRGCATAVLEELDHLSGVSVLICCGSGNNGGDGYVIARCLANEGVDVRVLSTCPGDKIQGDAAVMRGIVEKLGLPLLDMDQDFDPEAEEEFLQVDLVVDALLGTGSEGAPRAEVAQIIEWINTEELPVVAVDIPSGVCADTGVCHEPSLRAVRTVTMAAPKRGHLLYPGRASSGELETVDIGFLPEELEAGTEWLTLDELDLRAMLPSREAWGHKGNFGKVLVLAGSPGMAGAAQLACKSALRAGAGMVKLASSEDVCAQLVATMPEVMTAAIPSKSVQAMSALEPLLEWADLLLVGPGLGSSPETGELLRHLIKGCNLPVLLDADGINAFAGQVDLLKEHKSQLCITPHGGEYDRLTGVSHESDADRVAHATELAAELDCLIVLKGAGTLLLTPQKQTLLDVTGSEALASAGSGDVLAGVIAGMAAQTRAWLSAATLGVRLHALSGELAAQELGSRSVVSPDLLRYLPAAFRRLEEGEPDGEHHHH